MPATVHLNDIVEALEMQFDESPSFLDLETGNVETVSVDLLRDVEESGDDDDEDLLDGEDEEWETAKRIVAMDRRLETSHQVRCS